MGDEEMEQATQCADCTEIFFPEDRGFIIDAAHGLCWDCAARRGGAYDDFTSRWAALPHTSDLWPSAPGGTLAQG